MGPFAKWVIVFLLNALIGYLSGPLIDRAVDTDELHTFAATGFGGNSLLVGIVIGIAVSFFWTADIKWVKDYRAGWAAWFANLLITTGTKIKPEGT